MEIKEKSPKFFSFSFILNSISLSSLLVFYFQMIFYTSLVHLMTSRFSFALGVWTQFWFCRWHYRRRVDHWNPLRIEIPSCMISRSMLSLFFSVTLTIFQLSFLFLFLYIILLMEKKQKQFKIFLQRVFARQKMCVAQRQGTCCYFYKTTKKKKNNFEVGSLIHSWLKDQRRRD